MDKRDKDNLARYARTRGKKTDYKYLELFRAVDEQKVYDEAVLRERFQFSNFSEAKKHLMEMILRSLRIYDEHPETQMQNRLTEIRVLLDRSLEPIAMKKIQKAREIAVREERHRALLELADYELKALPFVARPAELKEEREKIVALRDDVLENLKLIQGLKDIQDKHLANVLGEASRSGRFDPEAVRQIEATPELSQPDAELPVRAQSTKYRIWNVVRHHQLDFKGRAEVLEKMMGLFERHSFLIDEEPVRYVYTVGGYCLCLNVIGRYEDALQATLKLLDLPSHNDKVRLANFINLATNLSIYTFNTGNTRPLAEHEGYLMAGLREHRDKTPGATLTYILYLFSMAFWLAGNVRRAQRFARRVVEEPNGRVNLQAACRCFLLIFAYEQDDPEQIMKYARKWRRQWKQSGSSFAVEQGFTDFMVQLIDLGDWRDRSAALRTYANELAETLAGGFKVRSDNFVLLGRWLEARQQGRSLVDVVREGAVQA